MRDPDLLILGAGAAGLLAGVTAAEQGVRVTLLDAGREAGRKFRLAGGGFGNVTNLGVRPEAYVGRQPGFCARALRALPPRRVLDLLAAYGLSWEEREAGEIFCREPVARLVDGLVDRFRALGGQFLPERECEAVRLEPSDLPGDLPPPEPGDAAPGAIKTRFAVESAGECLHARCLLLALGSPAWPSSGATDAGWRLARSLGHRIEPARPVLTPLILPENWPLHGLAGISLPVTIRVQGQSFTRDLLFTHKGLSGPAALLASTFWRPGDDLHIDFLPGQSLREAIQTARGGVTVRALLRKLLPQRLADRLIESQPQPSAGRPHTADQIPADQIQTARTQKDQGRDRDLADRHLAQLDRATREGLCVAVHAHCCRPTRTAGMGRAEAAAGGVDVEAVHPVRMESRLVPGLFFAGEILDITGMLGGYNLHWAFASGRAAALGVCQSLGLRGAGAVSR